LFVSFSKFPATERYAGLYIQSYHWVSDMFFLFPNFRFFLFLFCFILFCFFLCLLSCFFEIGMNCTFVVVFFGCPSVWFGWRACKHHSLLTCLFFVMTDYFFFYSVYFFLWLLVFIFCFLFFFLGMLDVYCGSFFFPFLFYYVLTAFTYFSNLCTLNDKCNLLEISNSN